MDPRKRQWFLERGIALRESRWARRVDGQRVVWEKTIEMNFQGMDFGVERHSVAVYPEDDHWTVSFGVDSMFWNCGLKFESRAVAEEFAKYVVKLLSSGKAWF